MTLSFDDLKNPVWITAYLAVLGSAYQAGYFYHFGYEFLSTVGASDWIFSLMVLSIPIVLAGGVSVFVAHGVHSLMLRASNWDWIPSWPAWVWLLLLSYFAGVIQVYAKTAIPTIIIFVLWNMGSSAGVWKSLNEDGEVYLSTMLWLLLGWSVQLFLVGGLYADVGGRVCDISFTVGKQSRVVYARSVTEGHLYRSRGNSFFASKLKVEEIRCPWDVNSIDDRMKLLWPRGYPIR